MGYKIVGDGSLRGTTIQYLDVPIQFSSCKIVIDETQYKADVDGVEDIIDKIILTGVYKLIGMGKFETTKVFVFDEWLRGVQALEIHISEGHPRMFLDVIFLPNLVEVND